jgi:hypothetical protein
MSGRSSTKGVYFRDGVAYIRYQDEHGGEVRESTKQRSAKVAEDILAKRKTEVAMRVHCPTRAFDAVTFAELADYWWYVHGSKTRRQFEYLYPKVLEYFADKQARDITCRRRVPGLSGCGTKAVSVERESPPHDRERHLQLRREAWPVRQEPGRRRSPTS